MTSSNAQHNSVTRVLEPGITAFSAAEVHVVSKEMNELEWSRVFSSKALLKMTDSMCYAQAVIPVGRVPANVLESYYTLISKHKQVNKGYKAKSSFARPAWLAQICLSHKIQANFLHNFT